MGILSGWRNHCRFSQAAERTDAPGAPGRGATRGGGGEEETSSLPEPSRGSDPRGWDTDKFLHLDCLKRLRPWRDLSPPHQGPQHSPSGLKQQSQGPLQGFQLPR